MRLTHLRLEEFRIYHQLQLDVPPEGLRIAGRNASGKTSLLEAIYLLATARSPRASTEREMINWTSNEEFGLAPFARVQADVDTAGERHQVELTLTVDPERGGATRKRMKVDGLGRRTLDVVGTLRVVLFEPEDLDLVLGSPSVRRRYLDIALSQLDRTYLQALSRYGKLLQQRNTLLKDLGARRARSADAELAYWDESLVTYGAYLLAARLRYLHALSASASGGLEVLGNGDLTLSLEYSGTLELPEAQLDRLRAVPLPDAQALVGQALERALSERRDEELRRGVTLVGPHRDDIRFLLNGRDLSAFGSRGQQRLAVVATKLAELGQVLADTGDPPLLLLDDVLSELDAVHRDRLLAGIGAAGCQVLITGTDPHLLEHPALAALPSVDVSNGILTVVGES